MKSLKDRIDELKNNIGITSSESKTETIEFDYKKNREEYERLANADILHKQKQIKQRRISDLQGQSDLNPNWTFANLNKDAEDVIDAINIAESFIFAHNDSTWRNKRAHMMLFYGDYGRGKSHIAGAIAHELINRFEISVLYRELQTLLDLRLYSYDFNSSHDSSSIFRELSQQLLNVELLIIDEIGVNETVLKTNAQSWLGNLLRQRKALCKNSILITNHSLNNLESVIGRYCFESIKEYETYQIQFSGPSRRPNIEQAVDTPKENYSSANYTPNNINYRK